MPPLNCHGKPACATQRGPSPRVVSVSSAKLMRGHGSCVRRRRKRVRRPGTQLRNQWAASGWRCCPTWTRSSPPPSRSRGAAVGVAVAGDRGPDVLVVHPAALGGGVALRRVADTVRPTQTDPGTATGGRLLGPDGRYEHVPLRFVRVREADIDALSSAAAALGKPVRTEAVSDALRLHAGHRPLDRQFPDPRYRPGGVGRAGRRGPGPEMDPRRGAAPRPPRPAGRRRRRWGAHRGRETAYQRVITRFNRIWTLADPVDRFAY